MAADQELRRGQTLEFERLGVASPFGCLEIRVRRLGASAGVGECVPQFLPERLRLRIGAGVKYQRHPVELGGVVERQGRRGLIGCAGVVLTRQGRFAGAAVVLG